MMESSNYKLIDILVVEDNPGDALLIMEVLKSNKIHNSLTIVKDGVEAMDFLFKR